MKRGVLLLICPLLACSDIGDMQPGTTPGGDDTMGPESGESTATEGDTDPSTTSVDDGSSASSDDPICGDNHQDEGEECDGIDLDGHLCADMDMGFTGGELSCTTACGFDTTACAPVPSPQAGDLVITEIMMTLHWADATDAWFEIHNPTLGTAFQLEGCTVGGGEGPGFTIDTDMVIGPGEYRLFAAESQYDLGFTADHRWQAGDLGFADYDGVLFIECKGVIVDSVSWSDEADESFPDGFGKSASLDPGSYDATANDIETNWCDGITRYGHDVDLGTPRYSNPVCGVGPVDHFIDSCRLQLPDVIVDDQGTDVTVLGRLYIAALTDLSIVDDPAQQVIGHVGYGPVGTDPATDATWTWVAAVPNPAYDPASPAYEAGRDEYQATFSLPGPGTYDYAYRFSGDGGTTFTYCDGQAAGSTDGYQPANAGHMSSNAVAMPGLYFSEYVEGSSDDGAIEI